jgi:L-threonylcarbamoyladenylate synthase
MRRFWPGPLTLVLPARDSGAPSIAFRAPNNDAAQALLEVLGEPIASSSANPAGKPPPTDADQVIASLGNVLAIVLDGGPCPIGEPSTILDLSGTSPRILRQGALPASQLMPS